MIQGEESSGKKKFFSSSFAGRFATMGFFCSILLFLGGFFYGTKSMDAEALAYSLKQVFIPALIVSAIAYRIGKMFDNVKCRKKYKKPGLGKLKY